MDKICRQPEAEAQSAWAIGQQLHAQWAVAMPIIVGLSTKGHMRLCVCTTALVVCGELKQNRQDL